MKLPSKTIITLISIPILILLFFSSNIYGYFRFKQYCASEGGLHVYEKLEKNVGWLADEKQVAMGAAQLEHLLFVRFPEKNKSFTDVRYKGGIRMNASSYDFELSKLEISPKYHWIHKSYDVQNETRLHLYADEIYKISDNKLLAKYYIYSYEVFDRNNTLLDMPSEEMCHSGKEGSAIIDGALNIQKLKNIFL